MGTDMITGAFLFDVTLVSNRSMVTYCSPIPIPIPICQPIPVDNHIHIRMYALCVQKKEGDNLAAISTLTGWHSGLACLEARRCTWHVKLMKGHISLASKLCSDQLPRPPLHPHHHCHVWFSSIWLPFWAQQGGYCFHCLPSRPYLQKLKLKGVLLQGPSGIKRIYVTKHLPDSG
jgi:hypothetical protein